MDVRFTAGEFAKLCGISKQTLIFYDKENVVKPRYKDENNGYRYYTADQLEQLDSIMVLREMGLSLSEIREHMQNRSPEKSLQLLKSQQEAVRDKIDRLTLIERRIEKKVMSLQNFFSQDTEFHIKAMPSQVLAVTKPKEPRGLLEVDIALKKLIKQAGASGMDYFYQVGDIVPEENLRSGDFLRFKWAFLPMDGEDGSIETIVMPQGEYAVQCHFGPYTSMGDTYRSMIDSIRKSGRDIGGDSYEFCILDSLTSPSPEKYCTKIMIPVK